MKNTFSAKNIAGMGIFTALCYLLSYFEFPLFSAAGFLKLDFSNVAVLLSGFIYGPLPAIIITAVKELICFFTKSTTGGVGEIANFILTSAFILLPTIVYRYKKGLKTVIVTLIIASVIEVLTALLVNRFINFPLYMGAGAKSAFRSLYPFIIYFNIIKCVVISVITIALYKNVSTLFKKISS